MSHYGMTESQVEDAALFYLEQLGYTVLLWPRPSPPMEPNAERDTYSEVVLTQRLRSALTRINPHIPPDAIDEALRQVIRSESQNLVENNRRFHGSSPMASPSPTKRATAPSTTRSGSSTSSSPATTTGSP
jgi:type I site-specific restriction-modification system R (restriction) subunit